VIIADEGTVKNSAGVYKSRLFVFPGFFRQIEATLGTFIKITLAP
jgi:hypothetical protein